jgi:hypothetical protein
LGKEGEQLVVGWRKEGGWQALHWHLPSHDLAAWELEATLQDFQQTQHS